MNLPSDLAWITFVSSGLLLLLSAWIGKKKSGSCIIELMVLASFDVSVEPKDIHAKGLFAHFPRFGILYHQICFPLTYDLN